MNLLLNYKKKKTKTAELTVAEIFKTIVCPFKIGSNGLNRTIFIIFGVCSADIFLARSPGSCSDAGTDCVLLNTAKNFSSFPP